MRGRSCVIALALNACGGDPVTPNDASSSPDAQMDVRADAIGPDASPCNALLLDAPVATDHALFDADAPLPTGGSIGAGRYFLTDTSVYVALDASPPTLPSRREVHEFSQDGLWQFLDTSRRVTLVATPNGTTLHRDVLCPSDLRAKDSPFSAWDGGVMLFDYGKSATTVFTLTKQ